MSSFHRKVYLSMYACVLSLEKEKVIGIIIQAEHRVIEREETNHIHEDSIERLEEIILASAMVVHPSRFWNSR